MLTHLARTAGAFGRRDAAVALGGLVDKIHELKHKCARAGFAALALLISVRLCWAAWGLVDKIHELKHK